ncbi:MAG: TRAP transporter small permease [Deltaproteobacteria bacterium]|nr:TRAP transporter small permease [Deltaproteobacteria bacterium]
MSLKIFKIVGRVNKWFLYIAALLVFGTVVVAFADVMSRLLFNKSIFWASQVATWMMLILSFLGAGMILWERGHINMDFLPSLIGGRPKKIIDIINHAGALIFVIIALVAGIDYTWQLFIKNTTRSVGSYNIPYWPIILIAAAIGPAVLLIFNIAMLWRIIKEPPEEVVKKDVESELEKGS